MKSERLIIILLSILCAVLFFFARMSSKETEEFKRKLEIKQQEVAELKARNTATNQTIVEIIKKPDGTVIEKRTINEKTTQEITHNTVNNIDYSDTESYKKETGLERYSIGVYKAIDSNKYSADFGARLGNLPIEAVILTTENGKDFYVGARLRW